jgi:hypothetical protein
MLEMGTIHDIIGIDSGNVNGDCQGVREREPDCKNACEQSSQHDNKESNHEMIRTAGAIVGHTATPHDIIFLGQYRKGRVEFGIERIFPRSLDQRRGQVANAFSRNIGQGITHAPTSFASRNVAKPNKAIALFPVQTNGANIFSVDIVKQPVRGHDDDIASSHVDRRGTGISSGLEGRGFTGRQFLASPTQLKGMIEGSQLLLTYKGQP